MRQQSNGVPENLSDEMVVIDRGRYQGPPRGGSSSRPENNLQL